MQPNAALQCDNGKGRPSAWASRQSMGCVRGCRSAAASAARAIARGALSLLRLRCDGQARFV
jgi:hypothetical protein